MRVLVACEYSGRVRDAFRAQGHDAWSCDLLPTEVAGPHFMAPVEHLLNLDWDLMIAHPPCTHLAVSGSRHFKCKQREQAEALDFVRLLMDAPIPRWCIENPVSVISSAIAPPPADCAALGVWTWRNKGNVSLVEKSATVASDKLCGGQRATHPFNAARTRSLERSQQDISRDSRCHERAVGLPQTATYRGTALLAMNVNLCELTRKRLLFHLIWVILPV